MATNGEVWNDANTLKPITNTECLQTVRVLHRTVVSLREALERSQGEVHLLKSKIQTQETHSKYSNLVENLALENHVLRRRILSSEKERPLMERSSNLLPENEADEGTAAKNERQEHYERGKTDSDGSDDVDDIELIFTTDDTKAISFQEELEPISDDGADLDDSKSEINEAGKEYFEPTVHTQSVLVGTDISKCGVLEDEEESNVHLFLNSNALAFNPATQRHILRADQLNRSKGTSNSSRPSVVRSRIQAGIMRPVLQDGNAASVRDSEAQTDISAIPPHWKSESFLSGAKENQNFPTLPSKFVIPSKPPNLRYPLKLMDKTQEARRILLSDISFTSMVPELSRSVDHLCQNGQRLPNTATNVMQPPFNVAAMKYLKSPALLSTSSSYSSKFEFNAMHSNWNSFENSTYFPDQDRSTQDLLVRRRQSWRPSMNSLEAYSANRTSSVPPSPTTRRHSAAISSFSPAGAADRQFYYPLPDKFNMKTLSNVTLKNVSNSSVHRKPKSKVSFRETLLSKNSASRQSLPNMYVDTESTEDSTESLIDESEECVRRSIDTTLTLIDWPCLGYRYVGRTYSVPNLFLEFSPPLSARPFIARTADDLQVNYFVKVINKEGRVVGGRIQFVGAIPGTSEPYVGLLLPPNLGETDGTIQGLRLFACEKNCGLFVPFRKVVMAWKV